MPELFILNLLRLRLFTHRVSILSLIPGKPSKHLSTFHFQYLRIIRLVRMDAYRGWDPSWKTRDLFHNRLLSLGNITVGPVNTYSYSFLHSIPQLMFSLLELPFITLFASNRQIGR